MAAPRVRWWAVALLIAQVPPVLWLVFVADGWTVNRLVVRIWVTLLSWGLLPPATTPEQMDLALNVVMLVPAAALLVVAFPRTGWWWAPLLTMLGSMTIELGQHYLLQGRSGELIDVITNTLGGVIGAGLGWLVNRALAGRERRRSG